MSTVVMVYVIGAWMPYLRCQSRHRHPERRHSQSRLKSSCIWTIWLHPNNAKHADISCTLHSTMKLRLLTGPLYSHGTELSNTYFDADVNYDHIVRVFNKLALLLDDSNLTRIAHEKNTNSAWYAPKMYKNGLRLTENYHFILLTSRPIYSVQLCTVPLSSRKSQAITMKTLVSVAVFLLAVQAISGELSWFLCCFLFMRALLLVNSHGYWSILLIDC